MNISLISAGPPQGRPLLATAIAELDRPVDLRRGVVGIGGKLFTGKWIAGDGMDCEWIAHVFFLNQ